ncbi:MAG: hypothetical protein ACE5IF_01930 [Candidatus Bathyarchaeia archaeon]
MSYVKRETKIFAEEEFADPIRPTPTTPSPERCPVHKNGFRATSTAPAALGMTNGIWKLRTPIDLSAWLPGTNRRIVSLSCFGQRVTLPFTFGQIEHEEIWLEGDAVRITDKIPVVLAEKGAFDDWAENNFELNLDVETVGTLDLGLFQGVFVTVGGMEHHVREIMLVGEYVTTVPPATGNIEVYVTDAETGNPLSKVKVNLKLGAKIERVGYTDANGKVAWENVEEGQYILIAEGSSPTYWSGGYSTEDMAVTVHPYVTTTYNVTLTPLPKTPIPWYVWVAIPAAIGIGYYIIKRPSLPPIVIMK